MLNEIINSKSGMPNNAPRIICMDGTELSVQASSHHYCIPRTGGPYTHVEVGYLSDDHPPTWADYADGEYPTTVYGCVPVELVREYVEAHGGEATEATTSLLSVEMGKLSTKLLAAMYAHCQTDLVDVAKSILAYVREDEHIKSLFCAELEKLDHWYFFSLNRIYEDGSMDIHLDPFGIPTEEDEFRQLDSRMIDLPGPSNAIWQGYVKAASTNSAHDRIRASY